MIYERALFRENKGQKAKFITEELVDADSLDADLIVVCIGVRPNLNFVNRDQIEIDRGILIDDHMRTSNPDVYAAGDVSQGMNLLTGKREIIGLLANARYQVRTAQGGVFRQVQSLFYRYQGQFASQELYSQVKCDTTNIKSRFLNREGGF